MSRFNWDIHGQFRPLCASCNGLTTFALLIYFLLGMALRYLYLFPVIHTSGIPESIESNGTCNVFEGSWIYDESYPLYNASNCPFVEPGWNCWANGRKDRDYAKWRWKPKGCDLPRFDARAFLEKFCGKRVVFVGDSLGRAQWESFICLLMAGVEDKKSVFEVSGHKITKTIRFLGVRFSSFNLSIDFYRSVFLVQHGPLPRNAPKWVKRTLRVDMMDDISREWIDSDILMFNSGGWWTNDRLFHKMSCYFQVGNSLEMGMPVTAGYRRALHTWASWAETMINTTRTRVFFKTFEANHWSVKNWNTCEVTARPSSDTNGREKNEISDIIVEVVKKMRIPVTLLHVRKMSSFRGDGHVGRWSDNPSKPDCSHWCLPGVPETWNELLFSFLLPLY
ncbi:protein trichome berefringence-like 7 [Juglans microcarpa x Juglans regia]|uniref:protein trichome berefringence-like 7 n=1 Tax=Juglans microcarpa x Juglans regia TaxID=2249226 RepID=UPI001B7EBDAE|nr:protein trichome berefringence-like 7 [Juglans microcarpa x Juglans regia]